MGRVGGGALGGTDGFVQLEGRVGVARGKRYVYDVNGST